MKQWLLLQNNPTLLRPDWLPPADVWPELAPMRREHERLLAQREQEIQTLREVERRFEAEDAARSVELKASYLTGGEPSEDGRGTEEARNTELADARLRVEAATDALVTFLTEAISEIQGRASGWYSDLDRRRAEAEARCVEIRKLLAEAETQVVETRRLGNWLDRFSGRSALGHYPFEQMEASVEPPAHMAAVH
jgi:hypothetical protein